MRLPHFIFFLALLASNRYVDAASFDCRKAEKPIEIAVCNSPKLEVVDEKMASAYRDALAARGAWKPQIIKSQRDWLKKLSQGFKEYKSETDPKETLEEWLSGALRARTTALHEIAEREHIVFLENTLEAKDVCSKALNKTNMTWRGRDDYGLDDFTLDLPRDFVGPRWTSLPSAFASYAKFDFLNSGKASDVYLVSVENAHYQYDWYIVAAPGERSVLERRLGNVDQYDTLANELVVEFSKGVERGRSLPVANESTKAHPVPKLASRLLDTSATKLFGGWYTRSKLVRYKSKTYVVAESVNNGGGPTFALFKPQTPGSLTPLCYFRATPSLVTETREQLNQKFRCPAGLTPIETDLDRDPCGNNAARIDLKEWGGTRPVVQEGKYLGYALCGNPTIRVGEIGHQNVEENSWEPIDSLIDSQGRLLLTKDGPYLVADQESGEKHYRIIDNSLKAVCTISRSTLPPPGYRQLSAQQ